MKISTTNEAPPYISVSVGEREADSSRLSCLKIKNVWKWKTISVISLYGMHRENFLIFVFNFFVWLDIFTVGAVKMTVV
jgi:hypothetical protein